MSPGSAYPMEPYARLRSGSAESRSSAQTFLDQALLRRSVREFSSDPVPDDVIDLAIAAASSAPSGANMQPWKFVIVRDKDIRRRIREAAEREEKLNYEGRMPDEWLQALAPLQTDWQKPFLEIAPLLIVVFKEDYHMEGDKRVLHYYVSESVGIACGFLLAALNAAGLSTLTHTPSPMGFLREILSRPPNEKPFLLIPVGYPAEGAVVPVLKKKSLDEVRVVV